MQSSTISPIVVDALTVTKEKVSSNRLYAIDVLRGYALLAMMFTHAAARIDDFSFRAVNRLNEPIAGDMTNPTTWIGFLLTHIAPAIFVLLAGYSLSLFIESRQKRGWKDWQTDRFLLIRAIILLSIDQLFLNIHFSPFRYNPTFGVLSSVSLCIMALVFLRRLNWKQLSAVALIITLAVHLYYHFGERFPTDLNAVRAVLLGISAPGEIYGTSFPALAWLPVLLLGFIFSRLVQDGTIVFHQFAWKLGAVMLALWLPIRALGGFGNFYNNSFLVFTKVPPDLVFLLFYVGSALVLLSVVSRIPALEKQPLAAILIVFGQTSLFFYAIHDRIVLNVIEPLMSSIGIEPPLLMSTLITAISAVILYFICLKYRQLRNEHKSSILQYL